MKQTITFLLILILYVTTAVSEEGRLLRYPNASADQVAFCHGGDIYTVPVTGGLARRLTTSEGIEMFPRFSADGLWLAFSGEYDGNREIYTIPSEGGEPKRLTYSMDIPDLPERMGPDKIIMQWTADGKSLLYRSRHQSWNAWVGRLYYINAQGGLPQELPLPRGGFASLSPDGSKLAYNRVFREFRTWKRYRGGQADDIWIYDFNTKKIQNITNNPAQDIIPMWSGDKVYFLSDRDHTMNLFSYQMATGQTRKITNFDRYDVKFPSIGPKFIAFENGGYIYLMDLSTEEVRKVDVELAADNLWARPKILKVRDNIAEFDISPDGKRGLFQARGDIYTVPAEKGNIKNITNTSGVHERNIAWSPDGRWIAFISDETGNDEVYLVRPDGSEKSQLTNDYQSYRYELKWSPDSRKLINSDKTMRLFFIDVASRKVTQVAKSDVWEIRDFSWSPDSRWIVYTDYVNNTTPVVRLYSLEQNKTVPVTDVYFGSYEPHFSNEGDYLFFISNRTFNPTLGEFELSFTYTNMSKIYGITLRKEMQSPFKFESDEVAVKEEKKDEDAKKDTKEKKKKRDENEPIRIDTAGLGDRIFGLPVAAADYSSLRAVDNKVYYVKSAPGSKPSLMVYDLEEKKESQAGEFSSYEISADGKKIIFGNDKQYYISELKDKIKAESGRLNLDELEAMVDRKQEWRQIFDESWRQMKDFFYDPNMHGVDWAATKAKYQELLPFVTHRTDLTYIIGEMIGELNVGHSYVGGGEAPHVEKVPVGLLGAEIELDKSSGYYKITKIFKGRNWDDKTRSPLTEPGININEGDYIISVDGRKVSAADHPYSLLVNKAGKFISLKVNDRPASDGAREYNVKTIASEKALRYMDWVETNRRKVDSATRGAVGYVQIPDMSIEGLNEFVKYFYPQIYKQGLIIDDRYNGGGFVSQMIIERLRRVLTMVDVARNQGVVMTYPSAVFTGPMVCLLNELSASDGDIFPYQFRKNNLGLLIGKRSWGGVIGIRGSLPFIDGGYMTRPEFANFGVEGEWIIEGVGTTPDIEVDNDPALEYQGIDQQLNKAIEVITDQAAKSTKPRLPRVPAYPDKK